MADEDGVAMAVGALLGEVAAEPWAFSADDARRLGKRRVGLVVAAHRGVVTIGALVASIAVVIAVLFAGVPVPRVQHPATTTPDRDGVIEGVLVVATGCGAVGLNEVCVVPGEASTAPLRVPGTVQLLPSKGGNPQLSYIQAPLGTWQVRVPPGTYSAFGTSWRLVESAPASVFPVAVVSGTTTSTVELQQLGCSPTAAAEFVVRAGETVSGVKVACLAPGGTIAATLPLQLAPPPSGYVPKVGEARIHQLFGHSELLATVNGQVRWLVVAQNVHLTLYGPCHCRSPLGTTVTLVDPVNGHALAIYSVSGSDGSVTRRQLG